MADADELPDHVYDGMLMHSWFPAASLDGIKDTLFDDTDIVVATYPKCGTTWMQEIVFLIHTDGDVETSDKIPIHKRFHFIEKHDPSQESELNVYKSKPPPQLVKTHLGANFFEKTLANKNTKFIVVFRNPKDMLVSYYYFYKMSFDFSGTWNEFFDLYKSKKISHGDYFDMQLTWWKRRDNPNVLILKYEDMLKSPEGAIRQVATHIGKTINDDLATTIVERTGFQAMKQNPMLNYSTVPYMKHEISPFMRKGTVGDWKKHFNETQENYINEMCEKLFKPNGLYFED